MARHFWNPLSPRTFSAWSSAFFILCWCHITADSPLPCPSRKLSWVHTQFCIRRSQESRAKAGKSVSSFQSSDISPQPMANSDIWEMLCVIRDCKRKLASDFAVCKQCHKVLAFDSCNIVLSFQRNHVENCRGTAAAVTTHKHSSHSLCFNQSPQVGSKDIN